MICQQIKGLICFVVVSTALCLPATVFAGGTYHSPPAKARSSSATARTRQTSYYLPPGAPLDRTYTWYAPPAGYEVIREGTPAAPLTLTVRGPDSVMRTYRLEGPVVVRVRSYLIRSGP